MSNNLEINQGADYSRTASILDVSNEPTNLIGYTVSAQIRKNPSSVAFIPFVCVVTNAFLGKISISLTHVQTTNIPEGKYVYDIFITSATKRYKVSDGLVTIIPQITR